MQTKRHASTKKLKTRLSLFNDFFPELVEIQTHLEDYSICERHYNQLIVQEHLRQSLLNQDPATTSEDQTITKKNVTSREQAATSREQAATSREQAATSKEQATTSKEQAATSRKQAMTSEEQATITKEQVAISREQNMTSEEQTTTSNEQSIICEIGIQVGGQTTGEKASEIALQDLKSDIYWLKNN